MAGGKPYQDKERLERLYWDEGKTIKEVAEACDCAIYTIQRWMDKLDVPTREKDGTAPDETRNYQKESWLREKYKEEGLSTAKMSELAGCSRSTIEKYMERFNIDRNGNTISGGVYGGCNRREDISRSQEWWREQYVEQCKSARELANELKTGHKTIIRRLEEHNIETRSRSEAVSKAIGTIHPNIYLGGNDRPYWVAQSANPESRVPDSFLVHRLAAVAWFGWDAVVNNDIHHKNGHTLDNRECNLDPVDHAEHTRIHYERGDMNH